MSEQKGAHAHGSLPGMSELFRNTTDERLKLKDIEEKPLTWFTADDKKFLFDTIKRLTEEHEQLKKRYLEEFNRSMD